jgi:hypothetical protein
VIVLGPMPVGDLVHTELYPGVGGSKMDEVVTREVGGDARRGPRVVPTFVQGPEGAKVAYQQTATVEGERVQADVKDASAVAELRNRNNAFATLINMQPLGPSYRLKKDPGVTGTDAVYHGRNADRAAAEGDATWEVVRILRDANGNSVDFQYKAAIAWSARADAGNWEL